MLKNESQHVSFSKNPKPDITLRGQYTGGKYKHKTPKYIKMNKPNRLWYDEARNYVEHDLTENKVFPVPTSAYKINSRFVSKFRLKTATKNNILKSAVSRFNYFQNGENFVNIKFLITDSSALKNPDDLKSAAQESYKINRNETGFTVSCETVFGCKHAIITISQDGQIRKMADAPVYLHRGLMFDSARHFLPVKHVKRILAGMELNKLNILHWHFSDHQTLSIQLDLLESNHSKLNYPGRFYTKQDVSEIIEFARVRGIAIMPEFDMPDHMQAISAVLHNITTRCDSAKEARYRWDGPLDVTNDYTYTWIDDLLTELGKLFSASSKIHIGNDEVHFSCWDSNTKIKSWMETHKMAIFDTEGKPFYHDYEALQMYFLNRVTKMIKHKNRWKTVGMWEDSVCKSEDTLPDSLDTVIYTWKNFGGEQMVEKVKRYTNLGFKVVRNDCWYLDHYKSSQPGSEQCTV